MEKNKLRTVIFVGPSGAGKGTQTQLLEKCFTGENVAPIYRMETGQRFRDFIQGSSYTSGLSKDIYDAGGLQPAFLAIWNWADDFITKFKGDQHIIVDGTPRRLDEARMFKEALGFFGRENVDVIYLEVGGESSTERLLKRGRSDDHEEEIAKRLQWFDDDAKPAIDFLQNETQYNFHVIDGEQSIEDVHTDICKALAID